MKAFLRKLGFGKPQTPRAMYIAASPETAAHCKTFAERLTLVANTSFRSKSAFARALDVGDTTLSNYLQGKTEPRVTELLKICELSGVNLVWLIKGDGPMRGDA